MDNLPASLEDKFNAFLDLFDKKIMALEKDISDLKKSADFNSKSKPNSKVPFENDNPDENYYFMANEDNDDLLNITNTFGTKHASLNDLPRKYLMDFKPPTDDPTIRTYIQGAPVPDNIFLSELSIAAVTTFVHKVSSYQQRLKIFISVGWNISSSIAHLLANLNGMSVDTFRVLSNPKIEQILKKSVQPKSAKEFIETIQLPVKI